MALYIIGLGLTTRGISLNGKKILKNIKKIYLESYTVEFPYTKKELEKELKMKSIEASRDLVESEELVDMAKKENIALLVYGSPLSATTHISLINSCKAKKIKYKILHAGSVFDAVAESGLQLYKFGKTTSLPKWQENYKPTSYLEVIKENQKIGAHTLLLIDIGLEFNKCKEQLKNVKEKVIVCSKLGIKSRFFYNVLDKIPNDKIKTPYCIIFPGKLSHDEEENLEKI